MRIAVVGTLLLLAACDHAAEDAEKQFEIVRKDDDADATCKAARKVADAWLARQDEKKYQDSKLTADIYCQSADLKRRYGN